jgi:hypothetical protein
VIRFTAEKARPMLKRVPIAQRLSLGHSLFNITPR